MEIPMFTGFTDMGMMNWNDLSFIHNSSVEDLIVLPANYDDDHQSRQANQKRSAAQTDLQSQEHHQPIKHHKTNNNNSWSYIINNSNNKSSSSEIVMKNSSQDNSSSSTMLSFSNNSSSNCSNQKNSRINPKEEVAISNVSFSNSEEMMFVSSSKKASSVDIIEGSPPRVGCMAQQSRDHIIAERKRREKLTQKFIALSAIIPGLKKMDKASVLGDAIKYVKQLQERVTKLEDEAKKKTMESAVYIKRSYVSPQNHDYDDDDQFSGQTALSGEGAFPEIEAKISEKDVLIKIHCDKKKRVVEKLISKIEELNLIVISSSSLAFGGSTLAVTIIAQMEEDEFRMTAKDVVKHLHTTLKCLT